MATEERRRVLDLADVFNGIRKARRGKDSSDIVCPQPWPDCENVKSNGVKPDIRATLEANEYL
jgi:hypothetical protein